jgi:hypothetical protein
MSRPSRILAMAKGTLCLSLFLHLPPGQATPFDCAKDCGVAQDAAFPHLVIGTVEIVADAKQGAALFQHMRTAGRWKVLPDSSDRFLHEIQPVSLRLPTGRSYTVLISRREADAAPMHTGDFVRYAPHRGINEKPPSEADALAYWKQIGCIAVLCRARDKACEDGYRPGVYRITDGKALSPDGEAADPNAQDIDLSSMRPRERATQAKR